MQRILKPWWWWWLSHLKVFGCIRDPHLCFVSMQLSRNLKIGSCLRSFWDRPTHKYSLRSFSVGMKKERKKKQNDLLRFLKKKNDFLDGGWMGKKHLGCKTWVPTWLQSSEVYHKLLRSLVTCWMLSYWCVEDHGDCHLVN